LLIAIAGSRMDEHLTCDIFNADFIVDLSNVVRAGIKPYIVRFDRLLNALTIMERDPEVRVYAVADESLLHLRELPQADRHTLARWRDGGLIDVVGDADERILELAELTGLPVISRDRFVGHRSEHPWLQGNTGQFLEPREEPDGRLVIRRVDLGVVADWQISQHAERDALKKQGLLSGPRRRPVLEVLDRSWRCQERGCRLYAGGPGGGAGAFLPRIRRGRPTCEIHGGELLDDGPRQATAQVKVLVEGSCVARFTIAEGAAVAIGRAPGFGVSLTPWLDDRDKRLISRTHLVLAFRNGRLLVRDQSTNGTRLKVAGSGEIITLDANSDRSVGLGDLLFCSARIALTRSGRRFPSEIFARGPAEVPRQDTMPTEVRRQS